MEGPPLGSSKRSPSDFQRESSRDGSPKEGDKQDDETSHSTGDESQAGCPICSEEAERGSADAL